MHTAIVIRAVRRQAGAGLRSRRTTLCCGVDPGAEGVVLVALVALGALILGWLTFRLLTPLPILGERLWGRIQRSRQPARPANGTGSRDAASESGSPAADSTGPQPNPESALAAVGASDAPGAVAKWTARTNTLIKMVAVVVVLTVLGIVFFPSYCDYTPRAKVSELILGGSSYRTAIAEKFQSELDPANAGAGLTFNPVGRISGGAVSRDGTIVIHGSTAATSLGFAATVTITPAYNTATGTVTWNCKGKPAEHMPATCR